MAILSKKIAVGGIDVTVREMTMQQISALSGASYENPVDQLVDLLVATTDVTREQLMPLAPSEVSGMIAAILEVNSDFLSQAKALGMTETAEAMERLIRSLFTLSFLT